MKRPIVYLISIALFLYVASTALAQAGGGYDLSWSTIDSGGGSSSGGGYTLSGTIGQADAGGPIGGGSYTLSGGFWFSAAVPYDVYLPLIIR